MTRPSRGGVVGEEGFEPSRSYLRKILSLLRLPISPFAHKSLVTPIFPFDEAKDGQDQKNDPYGVYEEVEIAHSFMNGAGPFPPSFGGELVR